MAIDNLRDFNSFWVTFGLLFFCLLTFTVGFMYNNSPDALGGSGDRIDGFSEDVSSSLIAIEGDANSLLNISSQNNPEVSDLGSKDSVATSFGVYGSTKEFVRNTKMFLSWVLEGEAGNVLISVFIGLFSMAGLYFIYKWIRGGA